MKRFFRPGDQIKTAMYGPGIEATIHVHRLPAVGQRFDYQGNWYEVQSVDGTHSIAGFGAIWVERVAGPDHCHDV